MLWSDGRFKENLVVPVGKELLGRVVNPLGEPIDGKMLEPTTLMPTWKRLVKSPAFRWTAIGAGILIVLGLIFR